MAVLEFFFDVASPYTYLASTRVEAIAADTGATLIWRPFLLGGVYKIIGNQSPIFLPARGRYMVTDLQRWATYYGVPMSMPADFPPNTLLAMRALISFDAEADLVRAAHALFRAYWVEGRSISDPAVIAEAAGEDAVRAAADPKVKQALIDSTNEAVERGVFGAPTFFVDAEEMYFGNDRLPFVEQALRARGR